MKKKGKLFSRVFFGILAVIMLLGCAAMIMDALDSLGQETRRMDPQLEHILVSGMFSAFFEIIIHNMPLEQARGYVKELREFYTAGWKKIMGL